MIQNIKITLLRITFLGLLAIGFSNLYGKEIPPKPNPQKLVNDYVGILNPNEILALERKLVAYDDSTSSQIAIVIENSLEGDDLFDYSFRIAREWGIGREGKWNGLLIYIAVQDRKMGIHVGQGLQGNIPDALAKRIIDNVLRPSFRENNFYGGLNRATDIIFQLASGEFQNTESKKRPGGGGSWQLFVLIAAVVFIIWINRNDDEGGGYYRGGRYDNDHRHRRGRRGGGWIFFPGGGWGGGSGGGGGGLGGGGFGGFGGGGGGFDGGGAFGDW